MFFFFLAEASFTHVVEEILENALIFVSWSLHPDKPKGPELMMVFSFVFLGGNILFGC